MKIIKATLYKIATDQTTYEIKLSLTENEIIISLQDLNDNSVTHENCNLQLTKPQLINISKVFSLFDSLQQILDGLSMQIEQGPFNFKKINQGFSLSFFVFGLHVNFNIPHNEGQMKILDETIEDYKKTIQSLTEELKAKNKTIQALKAENEAQKKEKENLISYVKDIIEKGLIQHETNEAEEKIQSDSQKSNEDCSAKLLKKIHYHTQWIYSVCFLKNLNKLASASGDKTVKIYRLDLFKNLMTLVGHKGRVYHVCQLNDGYLASSSEDKTIRIWEILKNTYNSIAVLRGHHDEVYKTIQLSNHQLASCSLDYKVKIWEDNSSYNLIHTLTGHSNSIRCIIELKNHQSIVSADLGRNIMFWNRENLKCENVVEDALCIWNEGLVEFDNKLIVAGDAISIIDLGSFKKIKEIKLDGLCNITSFLMLGDSNAICGCQVEENFSFVGVNLATFEIKTTNSNAHSGPIYGLSKLDESTFASCSFDKDIGFWKFPKQSHFN